MIVTRIAAESVSHEAALLTTGELRVWPQIQADELKFVNSIVGAMRSSTYCAFMTSKRRESTPT